MPTRRRLLVLTPDLPPAVGGIQLLVARLVDRLDGVDVRLVGPPEGRHPYLTRTVARIPLRAWSGLPHRGQLLLLNGCAVADAVRDRPDLVLNMHIALAPAAMGIRRLTGVPYVQYAYAKEVPAKPGLSRAALTRAARVIAISSYCRELVLEHGAHAERVRLITPGVDAPQRRVARRAATSPRIVTIGRLQDTYKGHDTLIRAMPLVRAKVPDVRCRVVGDGPLRGSLEALARTVGADAYVDFLGSVADAERDRELADATVFCMPSRLPATGAGEGFGIVYLEAGMHGVPSVAAGVGGSTDAVLDGRTGLLTRAPSDHVELANVLSRLLLDDELNAALGAGARRHAEQATWERMADAVGDVCRELVDEPQR